MGIINDHLASASIEPDRRPDRPAAGDRPTVHDLVVVRVAPPPLRIAPGSYWFTQEFHRDPPRPRPFLRPAVDALKLRFKAAPADDPPAEPPPPDYVI